MDLMLPELGVTLWDLLLRTNKELAAEGRLVADISASRRRFTGHRRPLSRKWAATIGMWGRIMPAAEVAMLARTPKAQVKTYKNRWGLKTATRANRRAPWELAAGLFFERYMPADELRCRWGVLPVEGVLYRRAFQLMLDKQDASPTQAVRWSPSKLAAAWADAGVEVAPPAELRAPERWAR